METSIRYWEDALASYTSGKDGPAALLGAEESAFCRDLELLLDAAYQLQEQSELLFLDQRSALFGDKDLEKHDLENRKSPAEESFASAVADLRDFDDFPGDENVAGCGELYQRALRHLEDGGGIPYRSLRTEIVGCGSDNEYLAKLHCLRLAFQQLLRDQHVWTWYADAGRQTLADMLLYADRDPKEFLVGYEAILEHVRDTKNWPAMEEELRTRGVKALTFYDVVLDYILMDAFEDLEAPPSSVTAVVQNRWLSDGFKETALATAVWSVLKAKRRMLKFPRGFMSHFYSICEQLMPLLAWGFLGPDETLKDTCVYFRDQVMGLLQDLFSFHSTRFTTVEELSEDVLKHFRSRLNNVSQRLCTQ